MVLSTKKFNPFEEMKLNIYLVVLPGMSPHFEFLLDFVKNTSLRL